MNKRDISIIGVGNLLMSDEGFGCHLIKYLEENYTFPDTVSLVDAGTAGIYMAPVLESCKYALFIDVIKIEDQEPGQIISCTLEELTAKNIQTSMSPHQIGVLEVIEICKLRGSLPEKIEFLAVVPKKIEPGVKLSPELKKLVKPVAMKALLKIKEKGVAIEIA